MALGQRPDRRAAALKLVWSKGASEDDDSPANCVTAIQHYERLEWWSIPASQPKCYECAFIAQFQPFVMFAPELPAEA